MFKTKGSKIKVRPLSVPEERGAERRGEGKKVKELKWVLICCAFYNWREGSDSRKLPPAPFPPNMFEILGGDFCA